MARRTYSISAFHRRACSTVYAAFLFDVSSILSMSTLLVLRGRSQCFNIFQSCSQAISQQPRSD
ncbi:hypothetical protein OH76DRAFT_1409079 [Lentinus brumalis]|uniref:Uncharacterized protein n=1 Tax=Lentinus brumalis TaxID=2498619 RepID=A0A371CW43_9APHY|nr:hypothetical protein OH76DRAFT_1409079 [Polyporus brumalis]